MIQFRGIDNNTHPNILSDPCLRMNIFWVSCLTLSSVFIGYDGALFSSLQALPMFFEQFPRLATDANVLGVVGAVYSLAGIYTAFIAAYLADRFGRKTPIVIGTFGLVFSPCVMAFAPNLGVLILGRWLLGTSTFLCISICVTLVVEIAHPRFRAIVGAVYLSGFYMALPVVLLPCYILMPASPRWLVAKDRVDEAKALFAKLHANGDVDDPLVALELEETVEAITMEKQALGWSALWKSKANRWRAGILLTIGVGSNFTGSSVVTYYLVPVLISVGITSYQKIILVSMGLSISNLFFAVMAGLLVERLGRRFLWFASTGTMLASMIIVTALSATFDKTGDSVVGAVVVAFLYIFFAGYDVGFTALSFGYSVEILPYTLRTNGLAFQNAAGCIGLFFSTWVNPVALNNIGWRYYCVFIGCLVAILFIIYFYFPETKGLTLEEVCIRFEGPNALSTFVAPTQTQQLDMVPEKDQAEHYEEEEKTSL